jgi:hypothetical protein
MDKPDLFSVPRRFDMATILVAMTGFVLIFTLVQVVVQWLGYPRSTFAAVGGMFVFVAVGQAVSIRWKKPREASAIAGTAYWLAWAIIVVPITDETINRRDDFCALLAAMICGPISGYLVGVLVGGVFLVAYHLREGGILAKRPDAQPAPDQSPWQDDVQPTVVPEVVEPH